MQSHPRSVPIPPRDNCLDETIRSSCFRPLPLPLHIVSFTISHLSQAGAAHWTDRCAMQREKKKEVLHAQRPVDSNHQMPHNPGQSRKYLFKQLVGLICVLHEDVYAYLFWT
jgi:hypothetical protein